MVNDVALVTGISVKEILGVHGTDEVRIVRQLYWKLLFDVKKYSYTRIAALNGYKSHATIMSGIQRVNDLLEANDGYAVEMWHKIRDILPSDAEVDARAKLAALKDKLREFNAWIDENY